MAKIKIAFIKQDGLSCGGTELWLQNIAAGIDKQKFEADYFYTDLASLQTYYGSIGDGKVADNGDGTYEVLLPDDGTSLDSSCWTWSFRDHGPKYMSEAFEANVVLPTDQGDGAKLLDDEVNKEYASNTFPVCYYTDEQLTQLTSLTTDIYNYVEAQYAHWVVDGGIDEEYLPTIFMPGFSTKINYETGQVSRGLGLSLVKDIVESELGGSISVTSEDGCTDFTIRIPKENLEVEA